MRHSKWAAHARFQQNSPFMLIQMHCSEYISTKVQYEFIKSTNQIQTPKCEPKLYTHKLLPTFQTWFYYILATKLAHNFLSTSNFQWIIQIWCTAFSICLNCVLLIMIWQSILNSDSLAFFFFCNVLSYKALKL